MSDLQTDLPSHQKRRAKKFSTHVDMTPMVDLAFLLLTFFILTTTWMKMHAVEITMPPKGPPSPVPVSQTISILLAGDNRIFWYQGVDDAVKLPKLQRADFSVNGPNSIHRVLLEKNKLVLSAVQAVKDSAAKGSWNGKELKNHIAAVKSSEKKGLIVLIKPDDHSKYKNLVDILDEMLVCDVARYAIVELSPNEKEMLNNIK